MKRLLSLLLCICTLLPPTWAGIEPTISASQPGTVFMSPAPPVLSATATAPSGASFTLKAVTNLVKLSSDQNSTTYISFDYQLKIPVQIKYYKYPNLTTPLVINETLTINYHPDPTKQRKYQQADAFRFADGYKVEVQVIQTGITVKSLTGVNLSAVQIADVAKTVIIQNEILVERYYAFNPATPGSFPQAPTVISASNELEIKWNPLQGAEEYDLEWVYIDDYDTADYFLPLPASSLTYDFDRNAARVQVKGASYRLPLVYERGYLLFRVRGIGRSAADNFVAPVPGVWFCGGANCQRGILGNYAAQGIYQITQPFENDNMNWQAVTAYAEEGKRKDLVKFIDGSNRIRQLVTVLSTERMALVGENIYDYQGRPAIQPLPVPVNDATIRFYPNFNQNENKLPTPYGPQDFDLDQPICASKTDPMRSDNNAAYPNAGAANYYSPSNPLKSTGFNAFIPDAEKFPFSQTEFMPDNTGRVRRQSGVGKTHQLNSKHETKYFYGTPMQEELDRLFGNEAGNAVHYKKDMVQDANGQLSIGYLDPKGNTIATSLAGECPKGILPLDSYLSPTLVTVDLLAANVKDTIGYALTTMRTLTVSTPGDYDFVYKMTGEQFKDLTCMNAQVCYDCIYDLELSVVDNLNCNKVLFHHTETIGKLMELSHGEEIISANCVNPPFQFDTQKDLLGKTFKVKITEPGTYTVVKKLKVNQAAADAYVKHFLNDPTNKCSQKYEAFLKTEMSKIDTFGCNLDCADIDTTVLNDPSLTPDELKEIKAEIADLKESLCDTTLSLCETAYAAMLADVSPRGQYGYIPGTPPISPEDPYVSVYAPNSRLKGGGAIAIFRNQSVVFPDEKGAPFKIDLGNGPVNINDNSVDMETFLSYWRDDWATVLVKYHPEYCYYEYCVNYLQKKIQVQSGGNSYSSEDYDTELAQTHTLAAAVAKGFVSSANPTAIAYNDPFFNGAVPGAVLSAIQQKINSYITAYNSSATLSMQQVAIVTANCPNNPASCSSTANMTTDKEWDIYRTLYKSAKQGLLYELRTKYAIAGQCYNGCIGEDPFNWQRNGFANAGFWGSPFLTSSQCCGMPNFWLFKKKDKRFPSVYDVLPPGFPLDFYSSKPKEILDSLAQYNTAADNMCCDMERHFPQFLMLLMQMFHNLTPPQTSANLTLQAGDPSFPMDVMNALLQGQTSVTVTITNNNGAYTIQFGQGCQIQFTIKNPKKLNIKGICCFVPDPSGKTFQIKVTLSDGREQLVQGNMQECPLKCPGQKPECPPSEEASELVVLLNYVTGNNGLIPVKNLPASVIGPYISGAMGGPLLPGASWQWQGAQAAGKYVITILNNGAQTCSIELNLPAGVNATDLDYCTGLRPDLTKIDLNGHTRSFVATMKLKNGSIKDINGASDCFTTSFCCSTQTTKAYPAIFGINTPEDILKNCHNCQTLTITGGIFDGAVAHCPVVCDSIKEYIISLPDPCVQHLLDVARYNAEQQFGYYLDSLKAAVRQNYLRHCLNAAEQFFVSYPDNQHHFTLYYYDQANNLVKTVPPAGVAPLSAAEVAQVAACRKTPKFNQPKYPSHTLVSNYRYNSLNQLTWQKILDHSAEDLYFYDGLGRLVASINARQRPTGTAIRTFSYTKYDALGRIVEVGENKRSVSPTQPAATFFNTLRTNALNYKTWDAFVNAGARTEITRTEYDRGTPAYTALFPNSRQDNLRGRVAAVSWMPKINAALGTTSLLLYSYDIDGNVKTFVQKSFLLDPKTVQYDYDLVSGKVNGLDYQHGKADQFLHRYIYDADNRLIRVRTSPDGVFWDKDATYKYYPHGPLARTELGDDRVQGLDYAYTIQGWIKGVNSGGLKPDWDMGKDGPNAAAGNFARDAFGYILGYYDDDYKAIGGSSVSFEPAYKGSNLNDPTLAPSLFNCNIRHMVTAIEPFMTGANAPKPLATLYAYDQLNRLRKVNADMGNFDPTPGTGNKWLQSPNREMRWNNELTYDANGNILTQLRGGDKVQANALAKYDMDNLKYNYYAGTNKLQNVADATPSTNYVDIDIDNQAVANNYGYDPIGNMTNDAAESLTISWNLQSKVSKIVVASPVKTIEFGYNPMGNRVLKTVAGLSTYHALDASGNVLATYRRDSKGNVTLESSWIYGSSRLGEYRAEKCVGGPCLPTVTPKSDHVYHITGKRRYEESNHLGNVLAVVSDRKMHMASGAAVGYFTADVVGAQDYYAFGMLMAGREHAGGNGRFGFNGKENVDEVEGKGNYQDYGMRAYDVRLGRFFSVDPLTKEFPWNSTYAFAENDVIRCVDLDGAEKKINVFVFNDKTKNYDLLLTRNWGQLYHSRSGPLGYGDYNMYYTSSRVLVGTGYQYAGVTRYLTEWAKDADDKLSKPFGREHETGPLGGPYGFHHGGKQMIGQVVLTIATMGIGSAISGVYNGWKLYLGSEVAQKLWAAGGDVMKVDWFDVVLGVYAKKFQLNGVIKNSITSVIDLKIEDGFKVAFDSKSSGEASIDFLYGQFKDMVVSYAKNMGAPEPSQNAIKMAFDSMKQQAKKSYEENQNKSKEK